MECNWHKLYFPCPKCTQEIAVMELCTSADGELMVGLTCANCGDSYNWRRFFTKIVNDDARLDMVVACKRCGKPTPGQPVKPPLQIAPPDTTEEDHKFLKDLGIDPESEDGK